MIGDTAGEKSVARRSTGLDYSSASGGEGWGGIWGCGYLLEILADVNLRTRRRHTNPYVYTILGTLGTWMTARTT